MDVIDYILSFIYLYLTLMIFSIVQWRADALRVWNRLIMILGFIPVLSKGESHYIF